MENTITIGAVYADCNRVSFQIKSDVKPEDTHRRIYTEIVCLTYDPVTIYDAKNQTVAKGFSIQHKYHATTFVPRLQNIEYERDSSLLDSVFLGTESDAVNRCKALIQVEREKQITEKKAHVNDSLEVIVM